MCLPGLGCAAERRFECQRRSENPVWATVYFFFLWRRALVFKGTLRSGTLRLPGCWVWFCGLVLGWPSREGELESPASVLAPEGPSWKSLALFSTQRSSSHGGQEKPLTTFYYFALRRPFFIPIGCSSFPVSPSLKGASVTLCQFLFSHPVFPLQPPHSLA